MADCPLPVRAVHGTNGDRPGSVASARGKGHEPAGVAKEWRSSERLTPTYDRTSAAAVQRPRSPIGLLRRAPRCGFTRAGVAWIYIEAAPPAMTIAPEVEAFARQRAPTCRGHGLSSAGASPRAPARNRVRAVRSSRRHSLLSAFLAVGARLLRDGAFGSSSGDPAPLVVFAAGAFAFFAAPVRRRPPPARSPQRRTPAPQSRAGPTFSSSTARAPRLATSRAGHAVMPNSSCPRSFAP
jgi:hypothetical protein